MEMSDASQAVEESDAKPSSNRVNVLVTLLKFETLISRNMQKKLYFTVFFNSFPFCPTPKIAPKFRCGTFPSTYFLTTHAERSYKTASFGITAKN